MRMLGGVLLWLAATVIGLIAALGFSGAGLGWSNGFIKRGFWEDVESEIGIGLSIFGLVGWLVLLGLSTLVMRGDGRETRTAARLTLTLLLCISLVAVVLACAISIGWPEPPSEYPTPPWNRA
ncbi:hypothetical protein [uncultured Microbacterium sp.]|uniref:hypothetical protein n=1 Tax=uncultured Microbacterium sp. TaxID=191216 RepID=UPI0028D23047|nr:hypothetical protein [uncultured Microbacterium sp.]